MCSCVGLSLLERHDTRDASDELRYDGGVPHGESDREIAEHR